MKIGERIRNLREAKNLKVTELAKKAYISQPYLSDIEKGRTMPSIDKLKTICDALEISLSEFFGELSELPPDLIKLIENTKKLTEEERKTLGAFVEAIVKERE